MAAGAKWPIGLICCFALLLFLIAASIVLALIPLYLPKHGSGIQPVTNPEEVVYLQYSATAGDGLAGSPSNTDDINNQLSEQLGVSKDLINAEQVQVKASTSRKRKRHILKNSLTRRKRQLITYQILIVIRITFPRTCRSIGCRGRVRNNVQNQISQRPSITLLLIFAQISIQPIRFSLIFVGFFLIIPDIFNPPSGGITSASTAIQTSTNAPTTVSTISTTLTTTSVQASTSTPTSVPTSSTTSSQSSTTGSQTTGTGTVSTGTATTGTGSESTGTATTGTGSQTTGTVTTGTGSESTGTVTTGTGSSVTGTDTETVGSTIGTEVTQTSTTEEPGFTSDLIDITSTSQTPATTTSSASQTTSTTTTSTSQTSSATTTTETPEMTSDLIDWTDTTTQSTTPSTTTTAGGQCDTNVQQGLQWFSSYGLTTINDFNTESNVKNRAIVCGSYTSFQSADFGIDVNSNLLPTNFTLQINGNIQIGNPINLNKGSLGVGTNPSHTIITGGNTQYLVDGRFVSINQGNDGANVRVDNDLSDTCQSITTSLPALSQRLSQLSDTFGNTVQLPGSQPSPVTININAVDSNGISVITVDGNTLLNNNNAQSIEIVIDSSVSASLELVIINLSGTSITFGQGNLGGTWLQSDVGRSHTIFNFFEATEFNNNNGKSWMGSILAPNADMVQNGQVTGAVAVKSLTSTASIDNPLVIVPSCI